MGVRTTSCAATNCPTTSCYSLQAYTEIRRIAPRLSYFNRLGC